MKDFRGRVLKEGDLVVLHGDAVGLMYFALGLPRGTAGRIIGTVYTRTEGKQLVIRFPGRVRVYRISPEHTRRCDRDHTPAGKPYREMIREVFGVS